MLSICAKLSSHLLAVRGKMQETVFTVTKLKIVPSYHQELVSHLSQSIELNMLAM